MTKETACGKFTIKTFTTTIHNDNTGKYNEKKN
jgi:hypothetical protein